MSASSWNARPCRVNGRDYPSLFAAAIDFEVDYSWLFLKLKKAAEPRVVIRGNIFEVLSDADSEKGVSSAPPRRRRRSSPA